MNNVIQLPVKADHISGDIVMDEEGTWNRVIFASDCEPCECCGEPVCDICDDHYTDCDCPGPTQDGIQYKEFNEVLYGREEDPEPQRREDDGDH